VPIAASAVFTLSISSRHRIDPSRHHPSPLCFGAIAHHSGCTSALESLLWITSLILKQDT
jgi:hypothetical protein